MSVVSGYINASSSKMGYFFASALTITGGAALFLLNLFRKQINAPPDTTVSFTTVDSHLPPDPPPFPVPIENGANGSEGAAACVSQLPTSIPAPPQTVHYRDPICTCGADPCATVPQGLPHPSGRGLAPRGWTKNISFASSVDMDPREPHDLVGCMSDEALFEKYYGYMGDCTTSCSHRLDNYFAFSDLERAAACAESVDPSQGTKLDDRWPQRSYNQCQPRVFNNPMSRRLKQSSAVSFSEPEGLARLGQNPADEAFAYVCTQPYGHSAEFHPRPPPCLRDSLTRPRRSVTVVEEITTSV